MTTTIVPPREFSLALSNTGYRGTHASNGDACEDLANRFHLTEREHQRLWDDLSLQKGDLELWVEWVHP